MGHTMDVYTDDRPELVHALSWSSVGAATGVGCFSVTTGRMEDLQDIRGTLRTIMYGGKCFESYPKRALMKSYSLTAFFPVPQSAWAQKTHPVATLLQQGIAREDLADGSLEVPG